MNERPKPFEFKPGEIILRENTPGDSAYIVLSGRVQISKIIDGQKVVLDSLGPGSIFGEMSLLDGSPRSATVSALEPTRLSVVTRARFQAILDSIPREVRPLFSSLSERLRNTSRLVSVLNQRERLLYSVCSLLHALCIQRGGEINGKPAIGREEAVLEATRVLAVVHDRIEELIDSLVETPLLATATDNGTPHLVISDAGQMGAFIEFLSEKLSHIPGFPVPSRKYSALTDNAQELLLFLKNAAGSLPRDSKFRHHYDFDRYVKDIVARLGWGVKDAILGLQNLSISGHLELVKFSEIVQGKAIVFHMREIERAQITLLQADEFEDIFFRLTSLA